MGLVSSGIKRVRVFELPGGIWSDGRVFEAPRVCLVRWHSEWNDKFYQVYVDGRFSGRTVDSEQRQMVVHTPTSLNAAVRVEVFAVEPEEAEINFGGVLNEAGDESGRVKITLLRSQRMPIGGRLRVYWDGGSGEIDYGVPVGDGMVWVCRQDKAGFGMSRFGESDFGYDWSAGVGFGRGVFGGGEFGVGADIIEWASPALEAGAYKFAVKVVDEEGRESDAVETREVTVIPGARPAEGLRVESFNKEANELLLQIG